MEFNISLLNFHGNVNKGVIKKGSTVAKSIIAAAGVGAIANNLSSKEEAFSTEMLAQSASKRGNIEALRKYQEKNKIEQDKLAANIRTELQKAIDENRTLTVVTLSEILSTPQSKIITIIYKGAYPEIRNMFDQVKDKSKLRKEPTENYLKLARELTDNSSKYMVNTENIIKPENIYSLAQNMTRMDWGYPAVQEFALRFQDAPAFADMLVSVKDKQGYLRKQLADAIIIADLFEAHKMNPELTESLLQELDTNGKFKYTYKEIIKLIEMESLSPELYNLAREDFNAFNHLFSYKNKQGEHRFGIDNIIELRKWQKLMPNYTDYLINDTIQYDVNDCEYRFSGKQICYILEQYTKDPELVSILVNEKNGKRYRHDGNTIEEVLKAYEGEDFLKAAYAEYLIDNDYAVSYTKNDDSYLVKALKNYNPEIMQKYFMLAKSFDNIQDIFFDYKNKPVFNAEEIDTLLNFQKKHPKECDILLKNKYKIGYNDIYGEDFVYNPQDNEEYRLTSSIKLTPAQIIDIVKKKPGRYVKLVNKMSHNITAKHFPGVQTEALYEYFIGK